MWTIVKSAGSVRAFLSNSIAGPKARFVLPQTRLGFMLDRRRVNYLVDHLGITRSTEMLLTCAEVDASGAVAAGLAHRVADDPVDAAVAWAAGMAEWPQSALTGHKQMLREAVSREAVSSREPR